MKAREVVLQTVASHLKEHEPPKGTSSDLSDKKGSKRGRPKSERKELDNELFKKLKKSNIDQEDLHLSAWISEEKAGRVSERFKFTEGKYLLLALLNGSTDTTSANEADEEPVAENVEGQGDEDSTTTDAGRPQRKRKREVNNEFLFY